MDNDPSIVHDSSESELADDEVVAIFPQNSGLYLGVRTCETHGWRKTKETKTF